MPQSLLLEVPTAATPMQPYYLALENDLVAGTFFFSMFALLGGAAFFFLERRNVPWRWHANMTLAGIICLIAGANYYYMQGMYLNTGMGPTRFRYVDWLFTVPLMCTQFYLLLRPAGAQPGSLWRLVLAGLWMIGFGYFGETSNAYWSILWGSVSTLGYLVIIYEIWFGPLARVADRSSNEDVVRAFTYLGYFVLIGWAIYPLGYMTIPFNVFEALNLNRNLVYNFGDVINKLGFGIVIYTMARRASRTIKRQKQHLRQELKTTLVQS
ncbi:bacteriorhodopsin-like [Hymenobacter weizhouensis]|uniref:bacteriorhodopsin-like n=1 Tax=Hymenobacter sp. YIM 151500-1 TaxID=2987689 RepID=UPI0022264E8E|nr:bacteriorhodopsin-like [Hymenobacter sp. YIM 151500-1]UYZ62004.1 bacteriorhodopsin-like [Hymenobacter sp. YIM 151500-1]